MANRSDWGQGQPEEGPGRQARLAEWDLVRGYHQGQRSCTTAPKGRTQDRTRPKRQNNKSTLAMREPSTQDIPGLDRGHSVTRIRYVGFDNLDGVQPFAFEQGRKTFHPPDFIWVRTNNDGFDWTQRT